MSFYRLYISQTYLAIAKVDESTKKETGITAINRNTLKERKYPKDVKSGGCKTVNFESILGYYKEDENGYLVLITKTEVITDFKKIRQVKEYELIQLTIDSPTAHFKKFLHIGFDICQMFFSDEMDLSLSYEQNYDHKPTRTKFHWNHFALGNLTALWPAAGNISQAVIGGYVREIKPYVLISRRLIYNIGFHIWNRGSDEYGHVANFVETEAFFITEQTLVSYVLLRGSVPLFWSQHPTGEQTRPFRFGPETESVRRFNLHFDLLNEEYSDDISVICLTELKGKEGGLTKLYQELAQERGIKFHQISVNFYMFTRELLRKRIVPYTNGVDWFQINSDGTVIHRQHHYIRVNCASSLDRTNMFQSILVDHFFSRLFNKGQNESNYDNSKDNKSKENSTNENNGKNIKNLKDKHYDNNGSTTTTDPAKHLELWKSHADAMSQQYAGTFGQKKAMTLSGYQDDAGKANDRICSRQRYVQSMTREGTLSDSYTAISQEKSVPRVYAASTARRFLLLVLLLIMSSVMYLQDGQAEAFQYWKKHIRNIINYPIYDDLRDADEYDESEFAKFQNEK